MTAWKLVGGLASVFMLAFASGAGAGLVNDVPSCYTAYRLKTPPKPDKLFYVLIDQTVQLDPTLQKSVLNNIGRMIQPSSRFVIAEFSAFSQGRYLQVLNTGIIEQPLDEASYDDIAITKAPAIRACFGKQSAFARNMIVGAARKIMAGATSDLAQSDIMAALLDVGEVLHAAPEPDKVLFLVSDALENSSVTSFYANNGVRDINAEAEMGKAKAAQLVGDLAGTKVYMLGSGLMPAAKAGTAAVRRGYRDPKTIHSLETFWSDYFKASNANLVEFGAPSLVSPVAY